MCCAPVTDRAAECVGRGFARGKATVGDAFAARELHTIVGLGEVVGRHRQRGTVDGHGRVRDLVAQRLRPFCAAENIATHVVEAAGIGRSHSIGGRQAHRHAGVGRIAIDQSRHATRGVDHRGVAVVESLAGCAAPGDGRPFTVDGVKPRTPQPIGEIVDTACAAITEAP